MEVAVEEPSGLVSRGRKLRTDEGIPSSGLVSWMKRSLDTNSTNSEMNPSCK
jgi:hypothetical protein